jgi:hypothetical protein
MGASRTDKERGHSCPPASPQRPQRNDKVPMLSTCPSLYPRGVEKSLNFFSASLAFLRLQPVDYGSV